MCQKEDMVQLMGLFGSRLPESMQANKLPAELKRYHGEDCRTRRGAGISRENHSIRLEIVRE